MTLKEKLKTEFPINTEKKSNKFANKCVEIASEFAIGFAEWKDNNFSMYRDKTYYANTSSQYFDITKYVGKEKPTKYYTAKELLEIYKKEEGL